MDRFSHEIIVSTYHWDAHHYDGKLGYVSEFGKDVVFLLQPKKSERILDVGCGTGDLSFEIARSGSTVFGIDLADTMIEEAPNLARKAT